MYSLVLMALLALPAYAQSLVNINTPSTSLACTTSTGRTAYPVAAANAAYVRIYNAGTVPVFVESGSSSVNATTSDGFLAPGAIEVFSKNPNDTNLACITATGSATIYFQSTTGN
jgi:hypothetical protein